MENNEFYNILLLGETGVGKSTFINSCFNYVNYPDYENAKLKNSKLVCPIPTKFVLQNKNREILIEMGNDSNESSEIGTTGTRDVKEYELKVNENHFRFIDTPGVGDTGGMGKDNENLESIMTHVRNLGKLHAICIVLRANVFIITPYFKLCLEDMLRNLDPAASRNVVFMFTHTSGHDYKAPDTMANLRTILKEMPSIPLNANPESPERNVFYCDNEAFKHLVARQKIAKVAVGNERVMRESWNISAKSSIDFMNYVMGLPEYLIKKEDKNSALQLAAEMLQPLADAIDCIDYSLSCLKKSKGGIQNEKMGFYITTECTEIIPRNVPAIICVSENCKNENKICQEQYCLKQMPKQFLGAPELLQSEIFRNQDKCQACKCQLEYHKVICYTVENIERNGFIDGREKGIAFAKKQIQELKNEKEMICRWLARYVYFLKTSNVYSTEDIYQRYLNIRLQASDSKTESKQLKDLILKYSDLICQIEKLAKKNNQKISPQTILNSLDKLYALNKGKLIKEMYKYVREVINQQEESIPKPFEGTITASMEFSEQKPLEDHSNMSCISESDDDINDRLMSLISELIENIRSVKNIYIDDRLDNALINLLEMRLSRMQENKNY